jgi:glycerol-3-phosphate acyltransferase PlsY
MPLTIALLVLAAYLIGSIPFALLLARRLGAPDLRRIGSGNLGAANVLRTSGVRAGVAVMLLDMAKGAGSVMLALRFDGGAVPAAAGLAAILGHVFPVWLRFRGGKGVATACGVFSVLTPLAVAPALAVFLAGVWITRYISVGSVLASVALPPIAYATGSPTPVLTSALIASMLIVLRHWTNLSRVRAGTEQRIGLRLAGAGRFGAPRGEDRGRDPGVNRGRDPGVKMSREP